ncbi:MAG TPA: hypothetical protein VGH43_03295 [Jatrophihabitans sp.]|jgi:hypothetical protein
MVSPELATDNNHRWAGRPALRSGSSTRCTRSAAATATGRGTSAAAPWLGQLRCDLKPDSLNLPHSKPTTAPGVFTPANGRLPKVSGQQKARVLRDQLPYWQPDLDGSAEWYASYNRRNRTDGIFGNLKNDATHDITRGSVRVMGLAKTAFLTMVAVMAVNLRLLERWRARTPARTTTSRHRRAADHGAGPGCSPTPLHASPPQSPSGCHRRTRPGTTTARVAAAPR